MDRPDTDYMMQKLREIRALVEPMQKGEAIDIEKCLAVITEVRASIPERDRSPEPLLKPGEGRLAFSPIDPTEFDYQVLLEAIEALAAEVHYARAASLVRGVQAYYAIEDDPDKVAELKSEIEQLHRNYRAVFGKPIPPNPNKR